MKKRKKIIIPLIIIVAVAPVALAVLFEIYLRLTETHIVLKETGIAGCGCGSWPWTRTSG